MYNINYIDGLITKKKYGNVFVKVLKISNFFVHIGVLAIILLSMYAYSDIGYYNNKIEETKKEIEEKRTTNRISEIEKEWEDVYYKLLAVKTQIDNRTNYGFIFRDLGIYLPKDNAILDLSFNGNSSTINITISKALLSKLTSFYDYAPILNSAFEKSSYLGHDVTIQELEVRKVNGVEVKTLKTVVPLNSRK